ncbi:DNA-binding transcriptional regulator, LysR family [Chitinophaga rupis]|uniref:DNA-binding transcriptional regulator, LysR family n=1 Tax=Chitinophaga rupis TaxID=573321 RepID=A0A1H8B059_9BACT|nr:LysR family transcriptional regulator [Chitinophaga rupis]SEM76360.1 DNA-binding transcriptional regulator, LysR family [Chitinophaga rupis]
MNLHDLQTFEAVAALGSFTKAAETMHTVQSNVTARIKSLEDEFKVTLFTRTSRRVELTTAGETLIKYCRHIGQTIEEAKRELSETSQVSGIIRIGTMETSLSMKLPGVINRFTDHYPDVEIEVKSAFTGVLTNDVLNYKLDLAFVAAPIASPELQEKVIKKDKLVIITASEHTSLKDYLKKQPVKIIVFDQGCSFRARLESWLNAKGVVSYRRTVMNSWEGIISFVEGGMGMTIVPEDLLLQHYAKRKIKVHEINKELGTLTTVLVYRKDLPQSRAMKAFIEMYA